MKNPAGKQQRTSRCLGDGHMVRNQKVADAERKQVEAWQRWSDDSSAANMAAWDRAVEEMRDAQDEAECQSDRMEAVRESEQAPWWVAAKHNARVAA